MTLFAQNHTLLIPGTRTTLDAHNCYPYEGQWSDRIERALAQGFPVAIEQDLFWYADPKTGTSRSVLAHTKVFHGDEPSLETYFFERVRPMIEAELSHPILKNGPSSPSILTSRLRSQSISGPSTKRSRSIRAG